MTGAVVVTKEFDLTRPYKYRNGEKPQVIFVLFNPTEYGKTIVSVHKDRGATTHFPDGKISKYWTCGADLINTN
jgi:hypothetical protein